MPVLGHSTTTYQYQRQIVPVNIEWKGQKRSAEVSVRNSNPIVSNNKPYRETSRQPCLNYHVRWLITTMDWNLLDHWRWFRRSIFFRICHWEEKFSVTIFSFDAGSYKLEHRSLHCFYHQCKRSLCMEFLERQMKQTISKISIDVPSSVMLMKRSKKTARVSRG